MSLYDFFDRKIIEEFSIKPEIKNMSKADRFRLLDRLFKEEYQGKEVNYAMLEKELFVKTTAVTRSHFGIFQRKTSFKGFMTKLNIGANGDYIPLISNCEYVRSADERKPKQNSFHRNTEKWHYFAKEILCEEERFRVQIDVRENKRHEFVIYDVGLFPLRNEPVVDKDWKENKKRGSINSAHIATDLKDGTSYDKIIPHVVSNVNREAKKSLKKCEVLTSQIKRAEQKQYVHSKQSQPFSKEFNLE